MNDRHALKRQYLEMKNRAGVYAIHNLVTGTVLLGSSSNVQGMLNRHRFELLQGTHRNARLSQDWGAHGATSFLFEVLDTLRQCDDPAFDAVKELELLLSLWLEDIPGSCKLDCRNAP